MKLIAISYGKKIAKFIATGYLITIKIALIMRIQVVLTLINFKKSIKRITVALPRLQFKN